MLGIRPLIDAGLYIPLGKDEVMSISGYDQTELSIGGGTKPHKPPQRYRISIIAGTTLVFLLACASTRRLRLGFANLTFACVVAISFLEMSVLWLYGDRYLLPVLPALIALLLSRAPIIRPVLASVLLIAFAAAGVVFLRDELAYNRALWNGVEYLFSENARPSEINGGYVVNGWYQYAHPENAHRDSKGNVVVNRVNEDGLPTRFQISNSSIAGWRVLKSICYQRWWAKSGAIYVLAKGDIQ